MAKNFLLSSEQKLERKLKEAILAIRIERAYSKDKILELYLNEIYLGIGSYGVAAAAPTYFNKELNELTIEEAAYLAALPKAPNNYHPFRRRTGHRSARLDHRPDGRQRLRHRARRPRPPKPSRSRSTSRPFGTQIYAADYFAEDVRRKILVRFGEDGLYGGGLSVRTTLDPNLQRMARKALIDGLVAFDRDEGLARARAEDRHRRRLGRGAGRHRDPARHRSPGGSASCSRCSKDQGRGRPAARPRQHGSLAAGARGRRDPLRRDQMGAAQARARLGVRRDRHRRAQPAT